MLMMLTASILLALAAPPFDPSITAEPDTREGLLCYWGCMALCVVAGKRQDQCDAVCTDLCFTVTTTPPGPACVPQEDPVACLEG